MARLAPGSRLNPEDLFQTTRTAVPPRVTVAIPPPSHLHRHRWRNSMPLHSKLNHFAGRIETGTVRINVPKKRRLR
jgi:hypothetical protein